METRTGGVRAKPHWTVPSGALFVIGLAIFGPMALLTMAFMISAFAESESSYIVYVAVAGGLPAVSGLALALAGLHLRRRDGDPPPARGWTVLSGTLFVLGLVSLIPGAIAAAVVIILSIYDPLTDWRDIPELAGLVAGLPVAVGVTLVYLGLTARRRD